MAKKKKRVLVPLDYGELEHVDNAAGNPEERKKKVKELIDSIPASQEGLWNWQIKWDELDHVSFRAHLEICGMAISYVYAFIYSAGYGGKEAATFRFQKDCGATWCAGRRVDTICAGFHTKTTAS